MTTPENPGEAGRDPFEKASDGQQDDAPQPQYAPPPQYGAPQYGNAQYGQQPYAQQPYAQHPGLPPDNYLVWAILSTVFCCLPLGVVSIVKSASVTNLWAVGDHAGAQRAADEAKKFALWSLYAQIVAIVLFVIVYVIIIAIGVMAMDSNVT